MNDAGSVAFRYSLERGGTGVLLWTVLEALGLVSLGVFGLGWRVV
ncbi:MAG: hypothetical protein RIG82_11960 [Phycisphaeraceae bacterium]